MEYLAKAVPIELPDPIINKNQSIKNCMLTYYYWNKLIETKAVWRYQIEQLYDIQERWCEELKIPVQKLPQLNPVNVRSHDNLSWHHLFATDFDLATKIKEMAERYGYDK